MNFATVFNVPCVFFCQNNQWAISVPREARWPARRWRRRRGVWHCIQVDGNDLFAVYKASRDAIDRARAGGGVTLIEAITYRLADHTTADDARRYRDEEEVASWRGKDPLIRLRKYLERKGLWDDAKQAAHDEKCKVQVAEIVKNAEGIEKPSVDDIFDYTFGTELPAELQRQKATLRTTSLGQDPEQAGLGGERQNA